MKKKNTKKKGGERRSFYQAKRDLFSILLRGKKEEKRNFSPFD